MRRTGGVFSLVRTPNPLCIWFEYENFQQYFGRQAWPTRRVPRWFISELPQNREKERMRAGTERFIKLPWEQCALADFNFRSNSEDMIKIFKRDTCGIKYSLPSSTRPEHSRSAEPLRTTFELFIVRETLSTKGTHETALAYAQQTANRLNASSANSTVVCGERTLLL